MSANSLQGRAAIVGIAELAPARYTEEATLLELMAKMSLRAIEDSGVRFEEVDGLVAHAGGGLSGAVPATVGEFMGLDLRYAEVVDLGGATGAGMIWRAAAAIASGMCSTCVCVTAAPHHRRPRAQPPPESPRRQATRERKSSRVPTEEFDLPYGLTDANSNYALVAQRYMYEYGNVGEQLAKIAVHQRDNACANPAAYFYGKPITVDDVLSSPVIADPLHRLDIVMPLAGAAAVVVTSADRAAQLPHPPAYLLGAGEAVSHMTVTQAKSLTESPVRAAAENAFAMSGVRRDQIGLASIYDCYTIMALLTLEDAGFCEKGEGGRFVDKHDLRFYGDFPVNTHGGQLSFGQPGLAGGMSHVTEAARQIQGRGGERQVADLSFAYVNGNGGYMSEQVSLVLGAES